MKPVYRVVIDPPWNVTEFFCFFLPSFVDRVTLVAGRTLRRRRRSIGAVWERTHLSRRRRLRRFPTSAVGRRRPSALRRRCRVFTEFCVTGFRCFFVFNWQRRSTALCWSTTLQVSLPSFSFITGFHSSDVGMPLAKPLVRCFFTEFYRVLPSFTEFNWILPSITGFLPSFTEFYRVSSSLTTCRPV